MRRRTFLQSALLAGAASLGSGSLAWSASETSALHAAATRRNLYVLGQFEQNNPSKLEDVVAKLSSSSFNALTLAFLGVVASQNKLQLLYNGQPFAALNPHLPELLQHLRTGTGIPRKILLSIGGWQSAPIFEAIRSAGVSGFVRQLTREAIEPLHLDGIDLDLEPMKEGMDQWFSAQREYSATLVALTNEYKRLHPSHVVSHAPIAPVAAEFYTKDTAADGIGKSLLASTHTARGNNVDWLNIQFYEGGAIGSGHSEDIATYYKESLAAPLLQLRATTGITQPLHFLQPAFMPDAKPPQSLDFCERTLQAINGICASLHAGALDGVTLWEYKQVLPQITSWSKSLEETLIWHAG